MRNFRLILSYDGTDFHGWQIQPNAVTVQGCLMEALEGILEETVQLHGSGTDRRRDSRPGTGGKFQVRLKDPH